MESFDKIDGPRLMRLVPDLGALALDVHQMFTDHQGSEPPDVHMDAFYDLYTLFEGRIGFISNSPSKERTDAVIELAQYVGRKISERLGYDEGLEIPLVTSRMVGKTKPHPAPYRRMAAIMELPPSRIGYVGDMITDVIGANRAGYACTVLTNHYGPVQGSRFQRPFNSMARYALGIPKVAV